jgi:hypothetical protein
MQFALKIYSFHYDLKVYNDGILNTTTVFLDITQFPAFYLKHIVLGTGFSPS